MTRQGGSATSCFRKGRLRRISMDMVRAIISAAECEGVSRGRFVERARIDPAWRHVAVSFIDDLVSVNITATTRTVSRTGFGTPLFAAYHNHFAGRVRSYVDLKGMRDDGFQSDEPAYLMAEAAWSQNPRPSTIKIGRRASAFSQVVDINAPTSPLAHDIFTATVDGVPATFTAGGSRSGRAHV